MKEYELIAKTFQGLEEVLAQELTELGANNVQIGHRMVTFTGNKEMLYRANFCLRTAVRVLKPIKHFRAKDADEVYKAIRAIDWEEHLDLDTSFAVDSVVNSDEFRHSKFVAYKVKDAIVDYFRDKTGERPNIRITDPDIRLNIHITDDDCTLSLDSSGDSLHLRGYRVATADAPINEVLAAALVKLSGWKADTDFIDPFCGSGTILIEAALIARNIYPGVFRKHFAFESWKDFDRDLLDRIYNDDSEEREFSHRFYGYDLNKPTLEAAMANAKSAGVADLIEFNQQDFRNFTKPENKSIIITNPPYGERLQTPDILGLYKTIGERLKHEFTGGEAWVISSKEELFDSIGLKPSFKIPLFNGRIDCEFRKYQIFEGKYNEMRASGGHVKTNEELKRMAEKHRFKLHREDFKQRSDQAGGSDYADQDFVDENPDYIALRNRHLDFSRYQEIRQRREQQARREAEGGDRKWRDDRRPREGRNRERDRYFRDGEGSFSRGKRGGDFSKGERRQADWKQGDRKQSFDRQGDRKFSDRPRNSKGSGRKFSGGRRNFGGER